MSAVFKSALGIAASAIVLPIAAAAIHGVAPHRDFGAIFPDAVVLLAPDRPVVRGRASGGADTSRVQARLDGVPLTLAWQGDTFSLPLLAATPGAHLLELGVFYRGGLSRSIDVPVLAGPFDPPENWIDGAFEITLASAQIDDHNAASTTDLAGALRAFIRRNVATNTPLGALTDCPIELTPGGTDASLQVRGRAVFQRGGVRFSMLLHFALASPHSLSLTASAIHTTPDERTHAFTHTGVLPSVLGALSTAFTGSDVIDTATQQQSQRQFETIVRTMLPRFSDALQIPHSISLEPGLPGAALELRFASAPRVGHDGSLALRLDARVTGVHHPRGAHGPVRLGSVSMAAVDGRAHVRMSMALLAALVDAYSAAGNVERDLNAALHALQPAGAGVRVRGVRLAGDAMMQPGADGAASWVLPDTAIALAGSMALPRDLRAFARGTLDATLRGDGAAVRVALHVDTVAVSCREPAPGGLLFAPCLSDAVTLGVDLPALINREMSAVDLFGDVLARIAGLHTAGSFAITMQPVAIVIDRSRPEPVFDLAARIAFSQPHEP